MLDTPSELEKEKAPSAQEIASSMVTSILAYIRTTLEARSATEEEKAELKRLERKGARVTLTDIARLAAQEWILVRA